MLSSIPLRPTNSIGVFSHEISRIAKIVKIIEIINIKEVE